MLPGFEFSEIAQLQFKVNLDTKFHSGKDETLSVVVRGEGWRVCIQLDSGRNTDADMECTSPPRLTPSPNEERRQSLRSFKVLDMSFKQFLKYLKVLKQGEAALRSEIERDEELTQRKSSRDRLPLGSRSIQPSASDKTERSSGTSDRRLYSGQCYERNCSTSRRDDKLPVGRSAACMSVDVLPNQRALSAKDSDTPKSVSTHFRKNNEDLEDYSKESRNYTPTERRNSQRTNFLKVFPDNYFWTTSVETLDLRRHSSGSTGSVFLPESPQKSKDSREPSDSISIQKMEKFPTEFRLPRITFSSGDDDVFLSPVEKTFDPQKSQKGPPNLSTSHFIFSSKATSGSPRRSQSTRQQKILIINPDSDTSRNHTQSNKGYSVIKEVDFPCACECMICEQKYSTGPIRVIYSSIGPLRKPSYLDGFSDGHGKPGWLASRRKEVQGLVFNRQTHSFHPPLPRKWNH